LYVKDRWINIANVFAFRDLYWQSFKKRSFPELLDLIYYSVSLQIKQGKYPILTSFTMKRILTLSMLLFGTSFCWMPKSLEPILERGFGGNLSRTLDNNIRHDR